MSAAPDPFSARDTLEAGGRTHVIYRLDAVRQGLDRTPYTIKVLLETRAAQLRARLRDRGGRARARRLDAALGARRARCPSCRRAWCCRTSPACPAWSTSPRCATRWRAWAATPSLINPLVPADLVIDHSVQVDRFGTRGAFAANVEREYERNQRALHAPALGAAGVRRLPRRAARHRHRPPGQPGVPRAGGAAARGRRRAASAFPDTLVGTDSHTTMINGLGVLGWGVGGIEAEAVLLGQPLSQPTPTVIGLKLTGAPAAPATTATDLVLTVTEMLRNARRRRQVRRVLRRRPVGADPRRPRDDLEHVARVRRHGDASSRSTTRRCATCSTTGRPAETIALTEALRQGAGPLPHRRRRPTPSSTSRSSSTSAPSSRASPARAARRTGSTLGSVAGEFRRALHRRPGARNGAGPHYKPVDGRPWTGRRFPLADGSVAIAAITSCTNTSNPSVMVGAGLLAKKAVERGPDHAALGQDEPRAGQPRRDRLPRPRRPARRSSTQLRFDLVGYGCTTCIGNSGPLAGADRRGHRARTASVAAAVLVGQPQLRGAHPPAGARQLPRLAAAGGGLRAGRHGSTSTSPREPLGEGADGQPVYLATSGRRPRRSPRRIARRGRPRAVRARATRTVFEGDERWRALPVPEGDTYAWDPESTYVQLPPFFSDHAPRAGADAPTSSAPARSRCWATRSPPTTSRPPASIPPSSPAGRT